MGVPRRRFGFRAKGCEVALKPLQHNLNTGVSILTSCSLRSFDIYQVQNI